MSSFTTSLHDGFREASIRTWGAVQRVKSGARERVLEQRGQTAAEYMGVLLLVALIIAALVALQVPQTVANKINELIGNISSGSAPNGGGQAPPAGQQPQP
jgi:hypothetical protein